MAVGKMPGGGRVGKVQPDPMDPADGPISYPEPGFGGPETGGPGGGAPPIPVIPPDEGGEVEAGPAGPAIPEPPAPDIPEPPESPNNSPLALPGTFATPGAPGSISQRSPSFAANRIVGGGNAPMRFGSGDVGFGPSPLGGNDGGRPLDDDLVRAIVAGLRGRG